MEIAVAGFYAGKEKLNEYLPYIQASKRALEITNPNAQYFWLTDYYTKKYSIYKEEEFVLDIADSSLPLMLNIISTQIYFLENYGSDFDLVILPDVDCLANKNLDESSNVGLAITHKGPKFHYRINNVAYVRDMELGIWFLKRALKILESWPEEKWHWWGDQEAWESALGVQINGLGSYVVVERLKDEILFAQPEKGRIIHLFPCSTHNCPMPDDGEIRQNQKDAYLIHFKGPRKNHIKKWFKERFGEDL